VFNQAAFMCAGSNAACTTASGQFGNLGRNSVYAPGQIDWDMAVSRPFQFHERYKLDLRADFFNILNHGNPSQFGTSLSNSGTFGTVTTFTGPRIIQMSLKFNF
jgi:hypothetical protein